MYAIRILGLLKKICLNNPILKNLVFFPIQFLGNLAIDLFFSVRILLLGSKYKLRLSTYFLNCDLKDRGITRFLYLFKIYEPAETAFIKKYVKKNMCVVDIGANIGYYSVLMSKLVGPRGSVLSFEASPRNYELLKKNIRDNKCENTSTFNLAISNEYGAIDFIETRSYFGQSHIAKSEECNKISRDKKSIEIETLRLDDFFHKNPYPSPSLIKMDIEGAEGLAFQGMQELINNCEDIAIIFELTPKSLKEYGTDPSVMLLQLREMGFRFYSCSITGELNELEYSNLLSDIPKNKHINIIANRNSFVP